MSCAVDPPTFPLSRSVLLPLYTLAGGVRIVLLLSRLISMSSEKTHHHHPDQPHPTPLNVGVWGCLSPEIENFEVTWREMSHDGGLHDIESLISSDFETFDANVSVR